MKDSGKIQNPMLSPRRHMPEQICDLYVFWEMAHGAESLMLFMLATCLKCLFQSTALIPTIFSNIERFWYQKLSHIKKALCVKFQAQTWCSLEEICEKPSVQMLTVV